MANVAVIAVHGVADQAPASSAREIADLLCADSGQYSEFVEVPLRIARNPLNAGLAAPPSPLAGDYGLEFMHDQLKDYASGGAGAVYDTVRLEGKRLGANAANVHVHEVYWADLSRAGESWYRLIAEFYQLLLHLPSLGRNAIKYARLANGGPLWATAHSLQRAAVWLLTVAIPLLNLALLSLVLFALTANVPEGARKPLIVAVITIAAAIGAILLFEKRRMPAPLWFVIPFVCVGIAVVTALWLRPQGAEMVARWLAIVGALVGAAACAYVSAKLEAMKKGAFIVGSLFGIATAVTAICILIQPQPGGASPEFITYSAALHAVQIVNVPLFGAWWLLFAIAILAAIAGVLAATFTSKDKKAAHGAAWTARFSLVLSTSLFSTLTLAIWLLITRGVSKLAPANTGFEPWPMWILKTPETNDLKLFMHQLLLENARGLEIFVAALGVFLLAAVWAAAPSIWYEIANPRDTGRRSEASGQWLSRGFHLVAGSADIMSLAFLALATMRWWRPNGDFDRYTEPVLYGAAAAVFALMTVRYLTKPFRASIDILLDVDNYLRESPKNATPRARIAERFHSLLQHLWSWRDAAGNGYDHIVIIAHSQGTVIAADVLRYLNFSGAPSPIPIRLFTMGSPLKQLYASAFPNLYGWINDPPPPSAIPNAAPFLAANACPAPAQLGVSRWANAYRSGDYVGRYLWLDERFPQIWLRPTPAGLPSRVDDGAPTREQFCAGAGAHTHYWDKHGQDIARQLDALI